MSLSESQIVSENGENRKILLLHDRNQRYCHEHSQKLHTNEKSHAKGALMVWKPFQTGFIEAGSYDGILGTNTLRTIQFQKCFALRRLSNNLWNNTIFMLSLWILFLAFQRGHIYFNQLCFAMINLMFGMEWSSDLNKILIGLVFWLNLILSYIGE